MGGSEHRQLSRDSVFVLVELRLDGMSEEYRIKMRNLSSGGMMAEGGPRVQRGALVWANIRNIGWTEGTIAWVHGERFGIAFREEIDPKVAREKPGEMEAAPRFVRSVLPAGPEAAHLRKI